MITLTPISFPAPIANDIAMPGITAPIGRLDSGSNAAIQTGHAASMTGTTGEGADEDPVTMAALTGTTFTAVELNDLPPPPGGGEDPVPTLRITSPGLQPNAPPGTPMPQFLQGQGYTATFAATVPFIPSTSADETAPPELEYKLESYTWQFPTGAVKGFGTFATVTGDPDGPHEVFVAPPTTASAKAVTSFTVDDLDYNALQKNAQGNVIDVVLSRFYFGPEAEGQEEVSVSTVWRKYKRGVDGGTATAGAYVTMDIKRPVGTFTPQFGNDAGITPKLPIPGTALTGQFLQFDKDWNTPVEDGKSTVERWDTQNIGFKWTATVQTPIPSPNGRFGVIQTLSSRASQIHTHLGVRQDLGFWLPLYNPDGSHQIDPATGKKKVQPLDNVVDNRSATEYLYGAFKVNGTQKTESRLAAVGEQLKGSDNPFLQLMTPGENPQSATRSDSFLTTLMFTPGPVDNLENIYIPLAFVKWQWKATGTFANGTWSGTPAAPVTNPVVNPTGNTGFPNWKRHSAEQDAYFASEIIVVNA